MNRIEFKEELLKLANTEVNNHGFIFSIATSSQIKEMISSGVDRMSPTEFNDTAYLSLAKRNIVELSRRLCERETSKNRIVDNRTFTAARFSICPLWPFC